MLAREDDRFILGLSGWDGIVPPTDRQQMAEYAGTLPSPDFEEIIRTAMPPDLTERVLKHASQSQLTGA